MRPGRIKLLFFLILLFQKNTLQALQTDSIKSDNAISGKVYIKGLLATSFNSFRNWKEQNATGIFLSGQFNINCKKSARNKSTLYEFRTELGYFKFIDSSWLKTKDEFFLSIIKTIEGVKTVQFAFSANVKSQITDTWIAKRTGEKEKWISGPILPATLMTGIGINLNLKQNSFFNFSIATIKVKSDHPYKIIPENYKIIGKTKNVFLYSEFGCSMQSCILKSIGKYLSFENKNIFFASGIRFKRLNLDSRNIITYKLFRFAKLQIENRIVYDYPVSSKLQFSNEMLLGFSFMYN